MSKFEHPNFVLLPPTPPVRELHTILRNKETDNSEFVFCADRLIRLVIELGLNRLPYSKASVITPTGHPYDGFFFTHGSCGVSVCRSGSIRIGKILLGEDQRVLYTRLVADVRTRRQ
ncbi:hypothetical protein M3Y99_01162600 [Aphelenchoides fujianensis]|nr:hypothetical protein M3Y99_01162600 [Aphelenchoides fujianensis]